VVGNNGTQSQLSLTTFLPAIAYPVGIVSDSTVDSGSRQYALASEEPGKGPRLRHLEKAALIAGPRYIKTTKVERVQGGLFINTQWGPIAVSAQMKRYAKGGQAFGPEEHNLNFTFNLSKCELVVTSDSGRILTSPKL
jgi:hypothetical protein